MFKIDTSKVTDASSEVKAAAKTLDSCLSSVQGYNVSCDGEDFPFDAAKNSIINSIQICQSKLQNTADSLEKVASIHQVVILVEEEVTLVEVAILLEATLVVLVQKLRLFLVLQELLLQ